MKFPRNARIARGQLDVAPFAAVFFLLVIFMLLGSLVYTPGARLQLQLPRADGLAGTDKPTVSVVIGKEPLRRTIARSGSRSTWRRTRKRSGSPVWACPPKTRSEERGAGKGSR